MTLQEIKDAVDAGKWVQWNSPVYRVINGTTGTYLIMCLPNNHCADLTNQLGDCLLWKESEFSIIDADVPFSGDITAAVPLPLTDDNRGAAIDYSLGLYMGFSNVTGKHHFRLSTGATAQLDTLEGVRFEGSNLNLLMHIRSLPRFAELPASVAAIIEQSARIIDAFRVHAGGGATQEEIIQKIKEIKIVKL